LLVVVSENEKVFSNHKITDGIDYGAHIVISVIFPKISLSFFNYY